MRGLKNLVPAALGAIAALAFAASGTPAKADSVADFYKGKTMKILVGYPPAGSYTAYAQLAARHYGKFIPGKPNVIVQNMAGAGSLVAANYFANVAPKDGSMIGMFADTLAVSQLLFPDKAKFDAAKLPYIGSFTPINPVFAVRSDAGVKTFADAQKKKVIVGCTGAGSQSYIMPRAMMSLLGANFQMICGYRGSAAQTLAMIRGEIQAQSSAWASWRIRYFDDFKTGKLIPIVQIGLKREKELPNLVLMHELTKDKEKQQILKFLSIGGFIGRAFNAPDGLPADRLKALRDGFAKMTKDAGFLADAAKQKANIDPETGEALDAMTREALGTPKNLVSQAQEAMKGYKKNCKVNCSTKKKSKNKEKKS